MTERHQVYLLEMLVFKDTELGARGRLYIRKYWLYIFSEGLESIVVKEKK